MFHEFHDGPVETIHVKCWFSVGVHGNSANLSDLRKGKVVRDGLFVKPHFTEIREISDQNRILVTAVGNGA